MRMPPMPALCVFICLTLSLAPQLTIVSAVQATGLIGGVASVDGKPFPNILVRLRNIDNGQLVGQTAATARGEFSFSGLAPGNYVAEMVAANGTIIGTSVPIGLTPTLMVAANVAVGASAAALAAAGGTAAAVGTGAAIGATAAGATGLSATVIAVSAVGATLGTTAVVAVANDASPSR